MVRKTRPTSIIPKKLDSCRHFECVYIISFIIIKNLIPSNSTCSWKPELDTFGRKCCIPTVFPLCFRFFFILFVYYFFLECSFFCFKMSQSVIVQKKISHQMEAKVEEIWKKNPSSYLRQKTVCTKWYQVIIWWFLWHLDSFWMSVISIGLWIALAAYISLFIWLQSWKCVH